MLVCVACTVFLVGVAALPNSRPSGENNPMHVETVLGGEHPDAHVDGFVIHEVITHNYHHDTPTTSGRHYLQRRQMQFSRHPHLRRADLHQAAGSTAKRTEGQQSDTTRRLLARRRRTYWSLTGSDNPADSGGTLSRDKVLTLAKLNMVAIGGVFAGQTPYGNSGQYTGFSAAAMAPLLQAAGCKGRSAGSEDGGCALLNTTSNEADRVAMMRMFNASKAELADSSVTYKYSYTGDGPYNARNNMGLVALLLKRKHTFKPDETVLVFRGSYSSGDYTNVFRMSIPYSKEKLQGHLKQMWNKYNPGGESAWAGSQQEKNEKMSDFSHRAIVNTVTFGSDDTPKLVAAFNGKKLGGFENDPVIELSKEDAYNYGYWPITKLLLEAVRKDLPSRGQLVISGHSQGGARAQLAGMYLQKKYPKDPKRPVITFAAVGASCFPRGFFRAKTGHVNILQDVDPTKAYPEMTDYQHPFDIYGANMGTDVGRACNYGTAAAKIKNTGAYKYCGAIVGYSGSSLLFAMFGPLDKVKGERMMKVKIDFERCRYFTHKIETMIPILEDVTGTLKEDGTTDGGCSMYKPIPLTDPEGRCPLDFAVSEEKGLVSKVSGRFALTLFGFKGLMTSLIKSIKHTIVKILSFLRLCGTATAKKFCTADDVEVEVTNRRGTKVHVKYAIATADSRSAEAAAALMEKATVKSGSTPDSQGELVTELSNEPTFKKESGGTSPSISEQKTTVQTTPIKEKETTILSPMVIGGIAVAAVVALAIAGLVFSRRAKTEEIAPASVAMEGK